MTQHSPRPDRKRRSFWFDPRFAIGLVLVAVSVLGVVGLVSAADTSTEVLAARTPLNPGQLVSPGDLVATSVRSDVDGLYLTALDVPPEGVVVTRSIGPGELVPAAAVGSTAGLRLTSIVLSLDSRLPASVAPGSQVDVWASRETETGVFGAPTVIVPAAIVVRVIEEDGIVVDDAGGAVEVLIPRFATARVLEAVANGAAIAVIPVDLPLGG